MSMYLFMQVMRQEALKVMANKTFTAVGKITGYKPENYVATVQLYSEDPDGSPALETGWLPIFTPAIGFYTPPNIGDIVEVHFQEGSLQSGYIGLRSYSNSARPEPVESGEFVFIHASGSFIKITNDGKVSINGNVEIDITTPELSIVVTGAASITAASVTIDSENISLGNTGGSLTGLMNDVAIAVYNGHTHPDPDGGNTGVPNQQLDSSSLTQNVKAN